MLLRAWAHALEFRLKRAPKSPVPEIDHYPSPSERSADRWVHVAGLAAGGVGGLTLLGLSLGMGRLGQTAAIGVYTACLMAMFACSAAYNMSSPRRRPLLRRFDHAAIFLMIAGSYTPFTTQSLTGAWAWGMTATVWALALAGVVGKLFLPGLGRGFWVALYLGLGWIAVIAVKPLLAGVSVAALILLAAGGLIYSLGVIVYVRRGLRFRRAIWHGFVVAAAATQYAAILLGVVLTTRA
jgi:hemolysin III